MRHPSPGALLELHFDESAGAEGEALRRHVGDCRLCAGLLRDVGALERGLVLGPDDAPPADGLDRVLARVSTLAPARARRAEWMRVVGPGAMALAAGAWAVRAGAAQLSAWGWAADLSVGFLSGDVLVVSVAALGVAAAGALVTLAVAPVLILESHGRS